MILQADARHIPLADESVQCVVTSPPYWGLRDYGIGEAGIGLEPTPELYVQHVVEVFREVRRVLRKDGTCWVNLGDSYATNNVGAAYGWTNGKTSPRDAETIAALKPKDLCGIPWRVAFALQADGWYLRSDIIWSKPNPMPESVTDRPTKSHEYIFLLTKSADYYYDAEAIREPSTDQNATFERYSNGKFSEVRGSNHHTPEYRNFVTGRNKRSVWTVATQPYPEAHFATFPEDLIKPCILAGTSARGACVECGASWERMVEEINRGGSRIIEKSHYVVGRNINEFGGQKEWDTYQPAKTLGWRPTCDCCTICNSYNRLHGENKPCVPFDTKPCIVLDPFGGSCTTVKVSQDLGRHGIALDLKPDYLKMGKRRSAQMGLVV